MHCPTLEHGLKDGHVTHRGTCETLHKAFVKLSQSFIRLPAVRLRPSPEEPKPYPSSFWAASETFLGGFNGEFRAKTGLS